ncbi:hypothetical protein RN001_002531 [Aquatica leii]|uniref:Uncharacterized protein n=1 Tax=Aquatica leii TaxID=1421715 RepID=A0AAN7SSV0_9COLE|nr:hypothetical protein RN001_002531 [Aquatica leii]
MLYLCRLCLKETKSCISLYDDNILVKIESLTSIKIRKDDSFPQICCESCMTSLYSAYQFQQCIIQADKTLRDLYNAKPGEIKIEEVYVAEEDDEDIDTIDDYNNIESLPSITGNDNSTSSLEITDVVMLEDKDNVYEFNYLSDDSQNDMSKVFKTPKLEDDLVDNLENENSREHSESKSSLECLDCGLKFKSKKLQQQHMAKHRVDSCPFCFVVMRRDNLKKHIQIHVESPEVCDICGKVAKNKESLRGHINYLHKKKAKTKCDYCEKEFKSNHHYNTHVRNVHLGIRNHQCHICGKKFFANHDLNKHINMTHKRARPYICPYCEKGFCSLYARKTHIRQHTHETPYRCEICSSGFRQKVSLITHMRSKHPDGKHVNKIEEEVEMLEDD